MSNGAQFAVDVAKWVAKAKGRQDRFVQVFGELFFEDLQLNSPVKTGFFRNNWQISTTMPAGGLVPNSSYKGHAAVGQGNASVALKGIKAGGFFYIYNNTSYGPFLEFGTSKMLARAPVRRTVARADLLAQTALTIVTGGI